ncbi:MAG: dihydrodipicolinate synthase family protein [Actinomycetota bacterium]|nr:dihydrodipicolinate synthase family protein [Actinomycetota bacterium]
MDIPEGVIVAMLTPFDEKGKINEVEVRRFVNFLIDKGVDGLFPVASCGEYTHMDMGERKFLIDVVVDEARGRVDVIPGSGATCYHKSIEIANYAKEKGCSGVVLHGPYFFQNTKEVVEGHLRKVAESVDIPIYLYNIPFFANEVTPQMAENLCNMPNVVGIKDSSGNMVNVMNLIEMTRKVNPDFKVLVGAEEILLPALMMGGKGCMTATAGIMPEFMVGMYNSFLNKNTQNAYNLQFAILPLIREMKSVNFPQGFKEALDLRGIKTGPPMMNYPQNELVKISDLKTRLELEMQSLLDKYFPGISLKYREGSLATAKFSYPAAMTSEDTAGDKKYGDCVVCGMCDGDIECKVVPCDTMTASSSQQATPIENKNNIDEAQLQEIIAQTIKKVLGQQ